MSDNRYRIKPFIKKNSRKLRHNLTPMELKLWSILRNRQFHGIKFRRQHPMGDYIADFVALEKRLIIEIDGYSHSDNIEKDHVREQFLVEQGFRVIRFSDEQVSREFSEELTVIEAAVIK